MVDTHGKPHGRAIMVLGTTSDAGKSVTAMALCRILRNMGYKVSPFKSQNMSLNAKVTADGHEISMIQELQCKAAGIEPSYKVNPILLKPTADMSSQVITEGVPFGNYSVEGYYNDFVPTHGIKILKKVIDELKDEYDCIIMEGAGSPAEINIYDVDIANMKAATAANADCILVVNVEWGGSFAYVIGTIMLMPEEDRKRIKCILYNNVRGNPSKILEGAEELTKIINIPVLGAVPHINVRLPQEDSEFFRTTDSIGDGKTTIAVIRLPRISNFTDLDPLYNDVKIKFVSSPEELNGCSAIIIPGTKNSISDMKWLESSGFAEIIRKMKGVVPILGICGGYQIMGELLDDSNGIEDTENTIINGLGLFHSVTKWPSEKKTVARRNGIFPTTGEEITGYEIHVGVTESLEKELFIIDGEKEGSFNKEDKLFGTYLHGVFEKPAFRRYFLSMIGLEMSIEKQSYDDNLDDAIEEYAKIFKDSINMELFKKIFLEGMQ